MISIFWKSISHQWLVNIVNPWYINYPIDVDELVIPKLILQLISRPSTDHLIVTWKEEKVELKEMPSSDADNTVQEQKKDVSALEKAMGKFMHDRFHVTLCSTPKTTEFPTLLRDILISIIKLYGRQNLLRLCSQTESL